MKSFASYFVALDMFQLSGIACGIFNGANDHFWNTPFMIRLGEDSFSRWLHFDQCQIVS